MNPARTTLRAAVTEHVERRGVPFEVPTPHAIAQEEPPAIFDAGQAGEFVTP